MVPEFDPEGRICPKHGYGQHIALTCKNHLTLRWSTKNIAPIGCRTIFYRSDVPECSCAASALQHVCETTTDAIN